MGQPGPASEGESYEPAHGGGAGRHRHIRKYVIDIKRDFVIKLRRP